MCRFWSAKLLNIETYKCILHNYVITTYGGVHVQLNMIKLGSKVWEQAFKDSS